MSSVAARFVQPPPASSATTMPTRYWPGSSASFARASSTARAPASSAAIAWSRSMYRGTWSSAIGFIIVRGSRRSPVSESSIVDRYSRKRPDPRGIRYRSRWIASMRTYSSFTDPIFSRTSSRGGSGGAVRPPPAGGNSGRRGAYRRMMLLASAVLLWGFAAAAVPSCAAKDTAFLAALSGEWDVDAEFRADDGFDAAPGRASIRPELGGCVLVERYEGTRDGKPWSFVAILGAKGPDAA